VLINPLSPKRFQRVVDSSIDRERSPVVDPFSSRAGDPAFAEWLERANRLGSSATDRAVFMRSQRIALDRFFADPQPVEDGPPTMLIRRRGAMSLDELDRWTAIFPGAECVTIEGTDSGVMALDAGLVAELAVGFITGAPVEASTERRLMAVLFTDLVESTPLAATLGDAVWRSTLDRYEAAMHATVQRHHGTVVKRTGDGALATFPSGSEAIAAAVELRSTTRDLGLEGRTGIHVGRSNSATTTSAASPFTLQPASWVWLDPVRSSSPLPLPNPRQAAPSDSLTAECIRSKGWSSPDNSWQSTSTVTDATAESRPISGEAANRRPWLSGTGLGPFPSGRLTPAPALRRWRYVRRRRNLECPGPTGSQSGRRAESTGAGGSFDS
jgi:hypothetical protein